MSGYFAALISDRNFSRLRSLFVPDEVVSMKVGPDKTFMFVSNSCVQRDGFVFQGFAIDHRRQVMFFDPEDGRDCPDPSSPLDGSYLVARVESDFIRIGADQNGYIPLLRTSGPAFSAVSDSFSTLVAARRRLGLACNINYETVRGRMFSNAIAYQQFGTESFCHEIEFETPCTEISISVADYGLRSKPKNLVDFYSGEVQSHAQAISLSATRMASTVATYASAGAIISLGLSAGHDSRACLAAILASDVQGSLIVGSSRRAEKEFSVVKQLCETLGLPLNENSLLPPSSSRPVDALALWGASTLGIYDPLYTRRTIRNFDSPLFSVGGHGAGASKGAYGWRSLSQIGVPPEAKAQSLRALERIGLDGDHQWGSEWQFLTFRNAIHGGRAIQSSDYVARPLSQTPLVGLSRSSFNQFPASRSSSNVITDVMIKLDPRLACLPFDSAQKTLSQTYVRERLDSLGGKIDPEEIAPYRIAGVARKGRGYSRSFMKVARSLGISGLPNGLTLSPIVREAAQKIPDEISLDIAEAIDAIDADQTDILYPSSRESAAAGKLMAINLLDP